MGGASEKVDVTDDVKRVIIIGSGVTGLAIAHGLQKAGVSVSIYEKNAAILSPGDRDWNMGLHWALPILKKLVPEFTAAQWQAIEVDPNVPTKPLDRLAFINGLTGETMCAPEIPYFHRFIRSKLRGLIAQGLDIRWNKRLSDVTFGDDGAGGTAIFEDGQHVTGDLIIGADGARSAVRRILLGSESSASTRIPYTSTFVQARYTREQALFLRSFHPLYLASPHPDGYMAFFGLQEAPEVDKPEDWTFFFYISRYSSLEEQDKESEAFGNEEKLAQLKEKAKVYCDPWKSACEWLPNDQAAWTIHLTVFDPSLREHVWDNKSGRVTLAGDAAHPMTFQRGQGLNHSVTDAGKIIELLTSRKENWESAIKEYEREMRARAGDEVRISVMNTAMLHDWEKVLQSPVMTSGMKAK